MIVRITWDSYPVTEYYEASAADAASGTSYASCPKDAYRVVPDEVWSEYQAVKARQRELENFIDKATAYQK